MKVCCNKFNQPLAGLMALEMYRSSAKNIEIVWGNESSITLPDSKKTMPYGTSNDLIRIIEIEFNRSTDPLQKLTVNHWLSFSLVMEEEMPKSLEYLDKTLRPLTYLVGQSLTVSDLAVFSVIYVSAKFKDISKVNPLHNIIQWMKLIEAQASVAKVLKDLPADILENISKASTRRTPAANASGSICLEEGKLVDPPHAEKGKVIVKYSRWTTPDQNAELLEEAHILASWVSGTVTVVLGSDAGWRQQPLWWSSEIEHLRSTCMAARRRYTRHRRMRQRRDAAVEAQLYEDYRNAKKTLQLAIRIAKAQVI